MSSNHVLLETIQLTQSAASVTFDNIPQTGYTDLKVVISARNDSGTTYNNILMSFNGPPSGTSYSDKSIYTIGTATGSLQNNSTSELRIGASPSSGNTSNAFSNNNIYIPNYRSSNNKLVSADGVTEANSGTNGIIYNNLMAGVRANTAAITSIVFTSDASNFVVNSTFSLYGVAAVGTTPTVAPKAVGGNMVSNDGTYWYHTFLTSGIFSTQTSLTCDYLVVAGGGSGGSLYGSGGGGAGGMRSTVTATGGGGALENPLTLGSNNSYTITVGAGGVGATGGIGLNGSNSSILGSGITTITSIGGGGGGSPATPIDGLNGGSGGGGSRTGTGVSGLGGSGTTNQGYAGGSGTGGGGAGKGGGGGGAGVVGSNAAGGAGAGGNGVATSISGSSVTYAGGGGGGAQSGYSAGAGGTGGGGSGGSGNPGNGTAGTANTGGGGGGGGQDGPASGGAGGSGIVIIRYAM